MSATTRAHHDWSGDGEELYLDCESTKGATPDQQQPEECSRMLFFARCPPTLPQHELLQLFGKFGHITEFNLYRRWAKAKNSKGCGTVVYADKASAAAAMAALDGKQSWPESESPMVVEWAQPSKLRLAARTDNTPAGAQPSSDAPTTKTPAAPGGQSTAAGQSSASSSNSSSMHTAKQQLPRLLPLLQPATHSSGSSSGAALSASQRLMHEAMSVQAASLDCHSSTATACSPLSEHEAQCTMPSHVVPMLASLMLDLPPAISGSVPGMQHASAPNNFMRHQCTWGDRDSAASLPQVCPPMATLPAGCNSNDYQGFSAEPASHVHSFPLPSLSSSSNIWSAPNNAMPHSMMHDNALLLQQQARSAAATAAMQSMSGPLLQASAGAMAAAAAAAPLHSTSCVWPQEDRSANLFYSAEHAYENVACNGSFAAAASAAAAAAAAAGHSSSLLAHSSTSGTLPSLLEVIPAMNWLQLQQNDQQHAVNAAAAMAGNPSSSMSGPFVSYAGSSSRSSAAGHVRAAQAASAALQEVSLDLNSQAAQVLLGSLDFVKIISGADVSVASTGKGLQLRLWGSAAQIESACGTLRLLLL
uniref:RRM domain-containing protein n=1 Tax=Tetradesmus obliquus TaxID=3088 RepID=A0A383W3U9_TETOB|eukprot:jgi/Sobl393_1/10161/SZX71809.1